MYKQFKKETPSGAITKSDFKEVMKQMGVVDPFLQDLVFNVFDSGKDGVISYPEFVHALSIMTRGSPDEKLECKLSSAFCALFLSLTHSFSHSLILSLSLSLSCDVYMCVRVAVCSLFENVRVGFDCLVD
jgi:hypothetical protein